MLFLEDEWWSYLEDIIVRSRAADQHTPGPHRLEKRPRQLAGAEIHTDEGPRTADRCCDLPRLKGIGEALSQQTADSLGPPGQIVFESDRQHRGRRCRRDGIATKGGEEEPGKVLRYGSGGDHGSDRVAVAERLSQRDDVGHDWVGRKSPEAIPNPTQPGLNLIGDENPSRIPHRAGVNVEIDCIVITTPPPGRAKGANRRSRSAKPRLAMMRG